MGMEKMKHINIYASEKNPNKALQIIAKLECFHPDAPAAETAQNRMQENKYRAVYAKANGALKDLQADDTPPKSETAEFEPDEALAFADSFAEKIEKRKSSETELRGQIELYEQALAHLNHLKGMITSIDDIFHVELLKARFGRLPKDSYAKLDYFDDRQFNFNAYDFDGEYYWGIYFTPAEEAEDTDKIFQSLYFERIWVPEFVHGKPSEAIEKIEGKVADMRAELEKIENDGGAATADDIEKLKQIAAWAKYESELFDYQKYAVVLDDGFTLSGYVPQSDFERFKKALSELENVKIVEDNSEKAMQKAPVKLKNRWFARPFEMFVSMYGLPAGGDIDPTPIVAITYSLLFGIMFGDVGQGVLLFLITYFIMWRKMKMKIGLIISRCSIFSVLFGFVYGSLFGFEEAMNPLYTAIGLKSKPIEVMESTNLILISSIAIGVLIIGAAMLTGIISKFKRKKTGDAIFSVNGISGFVFYFAIVLAAVKIFLNLNIPFVATVPYYILLLGVPFVCMFFGAPLTALVDKKPIHEKPGEIFINGFFEMFDAVLTFASNTMSFLRVGGFVLAHAGMMSVVFALANMTSGVGYWVIVAIGNVLVMGIEALFVGIQVLRLEFYEIFSRFLDANGTEFKPMKLTK